MKTDQFRIRLSPEDGEFVRKIAEASGLQTIEVISIVLRAAVKAIRKNGNGIKLPLIFGIGEVSSRCEMNEPIIPKRQ